MKKQYRWSVNISYMFSPILFWFVSASTFLNKSVLLKTNTLVLQISIKSCSTCSVNFHLNKLHFITRSVSVLLLLCFQNQSCILTVVFILFLRHYKEWKSKTRNVYVVILPWGLKVDLSLYCLAVCITRRFIIFAGMFIVIRCWIDYFFNFIIIFDIAFSLCILIFALISSLWLSTNWSSFPLCDVFNITRSCIPYC